MSTLQLSLLSILFFSCSDNVQQIKIANKAERGLDNHQVIITRDQLPPINENVPVVYDDLDNLIASQLDDLDNDGTWDELVFQISIRANETAEFTIQWVEGVNYPEFEKLTQIHLGYSSERNNEFASLNEAQRPEGHVPQKFPYTYQYEGPGWESNLVAFRSYFDTRNGKDIFGKTTEEMITHSIGKGQNYHELRVWGMDVLKVGSSLGAGGLAVLKNDSLIRLGETKAASFRKLVEGPVRSVFELKYEGWLVEGNEYELTETISIWANKRWYKSEVKLSPSQADTLATGIVNLQNPEIEQFNHSSFEILMSHGDQSENKDGLGMAVLVPNDSFVGVLKAPSDGTGITSTDAVKFLPTNGKYTFYFYAGWELENELFSEKENFKAQLKTTAEALSANLEVLL